MYTATDDDVTDEELSNVDTIVTLAIAWHTMRQYEKVLKRISRWNDDGPSIWARKVLNEYERRLDS
ncbi:MAG: hypothetical protein OEY28_11185 [Nitrospira sp.]|nr:hypothetical protein [Nitrospira sp.]